MKVNKGLYKVGDNVGKNNINWKGDRVGKDALHDWVKRNLGKANICSKCDSTQFVQWANKSHKYKRDLNDWIMLCAVCHRGYDKIAKLSREQATTIKESYFGGEKQIVLAEKYRVDQGTISHIVNNKIKYYV